MNKMNRLKVLFFEFTNDLILMLIYSYGQIPTKKSTNTSWGYSNVNGVKEKRQKKREKNVKWHDTFSRIVLLK